LKLKLQCMISEKKEIDKKRYNKLTN